jgi:hypothetical protein
MTDHEKAALEAAYDAWLRDGSPYNEGAFAAGWKAVRAYEPPASEAEERCAFLRVAEGSKPEWGMTQICGVTRADHEQIERVVKGTGMIPSHPFVADPSEAR